MPDLSGLTALITGAGGGIGTAMSKAFAAAGARVLRWSPTVVDTPMALVGWSGDKGARMRTEAPIGRFAKPGEIAAAALYLASAEAGIINGENLIPDGGFSIH